MRGVEERLAWYARTKPIAVGMCANHVMRALDTPPQGARNATIMGNRVPAGKMMQGRAPRGAIVYWSGGAKGDGHVCFALGDGNELSVDVNGANPDGSPRLPGIRPFAWFGQNWGNLRYRGWSWWWGSVNTQPVVVAKVEEVKDKVAITRGQIVAWWRSYSGKPTASQGVPVDFKWRDVAGVKVEAPPVSGAELKMLYLRIHVKWKVLSTDGLWCEARWVRDSGTPGVAGDDDPTAYTPLFVPRFVKSAPFPPLHLEDGDARVGGRWQFRCTGGASAVTLTTRYAKTHVIAPLT